MPSSVATPGAVALTPLPAIRLTANGHLPVLLTLLAAAGGLTLAVGTRRRRDHTRRRAADRAVLAAAEPTAVRAHRDWIHEHAAQGQHQLDHWLRTHRRP